jgi:AAA ATPase-like protein
VNPLRSEPRLAGGAGIRETTSRIAGHRLRPGLVTSGRGRWNRLACAMAGWGLQQMAARPPGREQACAVIDRLLAGARAGAAGTLVVRGEPGIGKSALLSYARQQAPPMQVLSASGTEAESDLAFAGLHELLRPVLGYLGELPGTQSRALAGALGLAPSAQPDRLLIGAAVLGLLAAAAEDKPTLCVVDDAHWLDRPSADALVFAARRLQAEELAILLSAREGEASRFEAAGFPELALTGLDEQSAAAILADQARQVPPSVRDPAAHRGRRQSAGAAGAARWPVAGATPRPGPAARSDAAHPAP